MDALEKKYEGMRAEALATLEVYFDNAAGIGEHPQVVEEMAKQTAEDILGSLRRNYTNAPAVRQTNPNTHQDNMR